MTDNRPNQYKNKQNQQNREQILELKNTYLSTVVHELKNLIITINQLVIKGISDKSNFGKKTEMDSEFDCSSRDKNENDEYPIYKIFHFLKGLCEYGMSLIADINTINRGNNSIFLRKTSTLKEDIKEFNLTEVINLCVEMFRIRASVKEKKVKIDSEINFPYNKLIKSINESKLKQIIINLLSNSLKFTQNGSIIVKAISLPYAKKIRILVKDTGVGFDSKNFDLDKPFKLYERNEKYNEHGAGLGLYIVQNILKSYQSCLKCQSMVNCGSTFYFDLNDTCPITDIINVNKLMTNELRTMINNINLGKKDKINKNNENSNQTGKIKVNYVETEEKEISELTNKGVYNKEVNNKFLSLNVYKSPVICSGSYAKSPRTNNSSALNKYYGNRSSNKSLVIPIAKKKNTCCVVNISKNDINDFYHDRILEKNSKNNKHNKNQNNNNNNKQKNPQKIRKMPKSFAVNGQVPDTIKTIHHYFDSTSSDEMLAEEFNKFNNMRNQIENENNNKFLSVNNSGRKRLGSFDPNTCKKIFKQLLETRKMYQNLNNRSKRTNYTDPNSKNKKRIGENDIFYANCIGFNTGKRMNIIICDDEPPIYESEINIIKKYFREKIKEKNITPFIYYARDGIECLNLLYNFSMNNIPIKFILIDKSMTYLSGIETSNIIKGIRHFKHNHIYLVTGDNVDPGECKADAFYPKPLTLDSFEKIMKRYI